MTYNYVPVNWRRWPVHEADLPPAPEEVPTPAKAPEETKESPANELPEQTEPATEPMEAPSMRPSEAPMTAPFGNAPSTPKFGEEPQMTPFGDEPQAPPSAADPLAVPLGDEPPSPPQDDAAPAPPEGQTPMEPAPLPQNSDATAPADSGEAPQMPEDDPFKDDPDSGSFAPPAMQHRLEQAYRERRQQLAGPQQASSRSMPSVEENVPAGPPRLLHADGGSIEARNLPKPEPATEEANPLRQVSHPVRKTASMQAAEPAARQWRRNPLRAN